MATDVHKFMRIVDTWPKKWRDRYVELRASKKIKEAYYQALAEKTVAEHGKKSRKQWGQKIPGGLAKRKGPKDFAPESLIRGLIVELEHTDDPLLAMEIAMDHFTEDINYYEKLATIEKHSNPTYKRLMR
jgi:hypothetical protein